MADPENRELRRKRLKIYGITLIAASAASLLYAYSVSLFSLRDAGQIMGYLSNSFWIPGILLLGMSGLIFVKRQGGFDGVSYGTRYMFNWLVPQFWLSKDERHGKLQSYREYCENKREREKKSTDLTLCFLIVGAVFTALGLLFLAIMNVRYPDTTLSAI